MLWYATWRDTRSWFLIGLGLLVAVTLANTLAYPYAQSTLAAGLNGHGTPEINSIVRDSSTFRGYVWVQLVRVNVSYLLIVWAVVRGAMGLFPQRGNALFTLSLPVSRRRVFAVRAATDLAELGVLAFGPLLLVPPAAWLIGYHYPLVDVLVYGIQIVGGGAFFYCLPLWLATIFEDRWRPILITLATAVVGGVCIELVPGLAAIEPSAVMEGEQYFRTGAPAWLGVGIWLVAAAALLFVAVRTLEARDF